MESLHSSSIRSLLLPTHDTGLLFPAPHIARFWKLKLDPAARTTWYKLLVQKVPLQSYLMHIGRASSPNCLLCQQSVEDLHHFWVGCPSKFDSWRQVLRSLYPDLHFTSSIIMTALSSLQPPSSILDRDRFLTILGSTLNRIWLSHWAFKIDHRPFSSQAVAKMSIKIARQILHR
ncbi:hypothetical protein [Absidia glauca]|uniref:Reverse transcriptase zinc-binding domain-containing protein n=1 Tax=Absidia glauca TaxID=4829 RepID=A0A163ISM6_ABSGL|nr:hypothetical protein [Absidia glauca]